MRTIYEAWNMIERNSAVTTAELTENSGNEGDTIRQLQLTNFANFPIVAFLSISFTHHSVILTKAKEWDERRFYIQFATDNKVAADDLESIIKKDLFHHQGKMPNNILKTIPDYKQAYRAMQMFKDDYLLDYINVDERVIENTQSI